MKVRRIKGRWYVYLWRYDGVLGKHETYVGPALSPKTREKALRLLLDYETRARDQLDRRIERCRTALARAEQKR